MTNSSEKIYFISGANRGIGFNLTKQLSQNGTVFATARAPEKADALNALAKENKNVHVIKLDVTSKESSLNAAKEVSKITDKVDVLIVNSGVSDSYRHFQDYDEEDLDKHIKVNFYGAVYTFQAIYPLLKKSSHKEVAFISSAAASVEGFYPFISGSYGPSKAALNHFGRQLQTDISKEGFTTITLHPGLVALDLRKFETEAFKGVDISALSPITPDQSASDIVKILNNLDESKDGKFLSNTGEELTW